MLSSTRGLLSRHRTTDANNPGNASIIDFATPPRVLLTGAGFSHNFGGFLADQMWGHILNNPDVSTHATLRRKMLDGRYNLNYEKIYSDLRVRKDPRFITYAKAVFDAYQRLDEILRVSIFNEGRTHGIALPEVNQWLFELGDSQSNGIIFTLNQDLFFERQRVAKFFDELVLPGIPKEGQPRSVAPSKQIHPVVEVPRLEEPNLKLGRLNLIKLHGSCNWIDESAGETMVIGGNKEQAIKEHRLLEAYFALFREKLSQPRVQLWIIGYGFRDRHINSAIVGGIKRAGLRIYVIDPRLPQTFRKDLASELHFGTIWNAIHGYIPNTLKGIFPVGDSFNSLTDVHPSEPLLQIRDLMTN